MTICPVCGGPNACAKSDVCWCASLKGRIRVDIVPKDACLCAACAINFVVNPQVTSIHSAQAVTTEKVD